MTEVVVQTLSADEARSLTDEVKTDAERLWRKLVELYDGNAHIVLGYSSWGTYFKAEFGGSGRRGYQLLEAGRVVETLQNFATDTPTNDAQARELTPLLEEPTLLTEAWEEAIETTNGPGDVLGRCVHRCVHRERKTPDLQGCSIPGGPIAIRQP